jgi:Fe-S-cluster-containing dehydrogenase component
MPKKYLIVSREQKCIGCGLCVLAASRYEKKKLGMKDSPINIKGRPGNYKIQIDYGEEIKDPEKILNICPQNVYDIIYDPS